MIAALMDKAIILARGLGTRMRRASATTRLTKHQALVAETGVKALLPMRRPFLDYVLSALGDAGYRRICLVIGPEHGALRSYYGETVKCERLSIEFTVQAEALGTADAVAAAETFAAEDPFLVINSDNYYPVEALRALRELEGSGVAVFEKQSMLMGSNISAQRLTRFAVVRLDSESHLAQIIEKPDEDTLLGLPEPVYISMNCWRFERSIFPACRAISPSARGEFEIPDAVQYAIRSMGQRFRVLVFNAPVLDLTCQSDVGPVAARLAETEVRL